MLTIDDCSNYISILKNSLNQEWLQTEFDKIKKYYETQKNTRVFGEAEDFLNPLAFLVYRAEVQIQNFRKSPKSGIPNEIVNATSLGIYVETLFNNKIDGIAEKINQLMNADKNQFEKLIFELNIASSLVKGKHGVKFLNTRSEEKVKTPDLLVDNTIEIECKKKDKLTKRDICNHDLWNTLERKLIDLMNSREQFYFVYIFFENDPSPKSIKKIIKIIRSIINQKKNGQFQFDGGSITIHKICSKGEVIQLDISASNPAELMEEISKDPHILDKVISQRISNPELLDYVHLQPDFDVTLQGIRHLPNGVTEMKELMKLIFKTKEIPDRLKSVINSIKDAGAQLSGERCGLVCVNITHLTDKLVQLDYDRLGESIQKILQNNKTISAVAITSEIYQKDPHGIRFHHRGSVVRNKSAKYPLPDDFIIMRDE